MSALRRYWSAVADLFTGSPAGTDPSPAPPARAGGGDDPGAGLTAEVLRHPRRLAAACLVTVLGPAAVVAQDRSVGARPALEARPAEGLDGGPVPVPVPGDTASWFPVARRAAATCPGLPSAVLVAIGHVESSLGLQTGPSPAGAVGPMQFLPSTWAAYGIDADGDGVVDVMNPVDAVHGAARLLCANGASDPGGLPSALWNYNRSDDYVRQVMALARFLPADS